MRNFLLILITVQFLCGAQLCAQTGFLDSLRAEIDKQKLMSLKKKNYSPPQKQY